MFSNKAAKLILFALIVLPVLFTSACAASSTPTAAPAGDKHRTCGDNCPNALRQLRRPLAAQPNRCPNRSAAHADYPAAHGYFRPTG